MRLRFIALIAVLAIPLLLIIVRQPTPEREAGRDARSTQWVPGQADPSAVQSAASRRLPLDHRFMAAVGEIHSALTGRPAVDPRVSFADGRWHIAYGDASVGSVSAVPGFTEMDGLLTTWARTTGRAQLLDPVRPLQSDRGDAQALARRERARQALDRLDPESALREVDRAWVRGKRNAADATIAASALTLMCVAAVDRMGTGDDLAARALAAIAIAQSAAPPLRRERALMAHVLGYDGDGRREAMNLPEHDPVRAFVLGDEAWLEVAMRSPRAPGEARVLWLLRLASRGQRDAWASLVEPWIEADRESELLLLATGLAVNPAVEEVAAAARTPWDLRVIRAEFARLTREGTGPGALSSMAGSDVVVLAGRFERALAALPASADGVFLDRRVLRAFYRTTFYSALARLAQPSFAAIAAGPALASAAEGAPNTEEGPGHASEFATWCAAMAEASGESGSPHRALLRIRLLRWFGAPAMMAVYDSLERRLNGDDPAIEEARRSILERMDARPNNLRLLGRRPG